MEALFQEQLNALKELTEELKAHQKPYLSLEEAAIYLDISKSCLYKKTSEGLIPHYKPGGKLVYVKRTELDAWIESGLIKSTSQEIEVVEHLLYGEKGGES